MRNLLTATSLVACLSSLPAYASTVDALGLLQSFNTIALGDLQAGSETEGTVYVAGDLNTGSYTVNGDSLTDGMIGSASGSLVVGGSINGNINLEHGDAQIGASVNGQINNNGGGNIVEGATIDTAAVEAALTGLSSDLAAFDTDTTGAIADASDPNIKALHSGAGGTGVLENIAILNVDANFFTGGTLARFSVDTDVTLIINASGTTANISGGFNADHDNVLVNFFEATTLNIQNTFGFGILAPNAQITANAGGIDGVVVGRDITQRIEFRNGNDGVIFGGAVPQTSQPSPVPLPATGILLIGSLLGLGFLRRKA